jgi:hypothetical protein
MCGDTIERDERDEPTATEGVKRFLSWGCGVQSTTLAVMAALGDLDSLDAVITADTGWERARTYEARDFYVDWLTSHGVRVEVVTGGNIRRLGAEEHIHMPFWTSDGGPLHRQCTGYFKVMPIRRRIRELMGYHPSSPPHPLPKSVELWLGISLDEYTRMRASRVKFITHRWPLIERRMTRQDCIDFLVEHDLPVPPRSACVGCPYRSASGWMEMRQDMPDEWAAAVEFDEAVRRNPLANSGSTAEALYVWQRSEPLAEADLEEAARREKPGKQLPLMICESGHCWI